MAFSNILYELKQTGARIQELLDVLDSSVNSEGELELTAEQIAYLKEVLEVGDTGAVIDDDGVFDNKTWSSSKIDDEILDAKRYMPVSIDFGSTEPAAMDALGNSQQEIVIDVICKTSGECSILYYTQKADGEWYEMPESQGVSQSTSFPIVTAAFKRNDGSARLKLTITDGVTSDTAYYTVPAGYRRRWGVADMPSGKMTADFWESFGLSTPIAGKGHSFAVNASSTQYIWYFMPKSAPYATELKFKDVNSGFVGGFHRYTNVDSSCPYIVYVSDNPGLGPVTIQPQ